MLVRNNTGRKQVDSLSGVVLPPMPLNEWVDLPYDVAMKFWRYRLVDIQSPEQIVGQLWKETDGMHVFWASPFSLGDGYGTAASQIVLALADAGIKLHVAWCWFHSLYGVDVRIAKMISEAHPGPAKVGICMATPGEFSKLPTPYRIGFTMYEADDPLRNLPEWRHNCTDVQMLFVPSEYTRRVFSSFVTVPIKVIPLITNPVYRVKPGERTRREDRKFVFGLHGTLTDRKSPSELIDAFLKAFPNERDVELQIKTRLGTVGGGQNMVPNIGDQRIKIIDENWPVPKMRKWLVNTVDCYVFPSKGEGFGLPPREAMLAGCPTIVSNNTGLIDLCNEEYNWPIPVLREESSPLGGVWRIPNMDYVIDAMRWIYHNRFEAQEKALRASDWYSEKYGPATVASQIISVLEQIDPDEKRKTVIPVETVAAHVEQEHKAFYEMLQKEIPKRGKVIDLGFGEGVFCKWAVEQGYDVTVIVEPSGAKNARKIVADNDWPVRVIESKLTEAHTHELSADAIVSQSVLQDCGHNEVEVILRSAMGIDAKKTWFSVPTVYYPEAFGPRAKLRRRAHWEDILADFEYEAHYYGVNHRYLWVRVIRLDQGLRATEVRMFADKGRMIDGVWHPNPTKINGLIARGEPDADTPHVSVQ